jgi:hypothetical protein
MAKPLRGRKNALDQEGEGTPIVPFLFFAYDGADTGHQRPYPPVPSYLCPAFLVNGAPYTGALLTPGTVVKVSMVVSNSGADTGSPLVTLFAVDPSTAFTPATLSGGQLGSWSFDVYPNDARPTPEVEWTVPGEHTCLFGMIECEQDRFSGWPTPAYDVVHDQHYGQRNINVVTASPGQKKGFAFNIGNPFAEDATVRVRVTPATDTALRHLARFYKAEPVAIGRDAISVHAVSVGMYTEDSVDPKLLLKPGEVGLCQLIVQAPDGLQPHQFFAVEVEQEVLKGSRLSTESMPTLGVVVFGS